MNKGVVIVIIIGFIAFGILIWQIIEERRRQKRLFTGNQVLGVGPPAQKTGNCVVTIGPVAEATIENVIKNVLNETILYIPELRSIILAPELILSGLHTTAASNVSLDNIRISGCGTNDLHILADLTISVLPVELVVEFRDTRSPIIRTGIRPIKVNLDYSLGTRTLAPVGISSGLQGLEFYSSEENAPASIRQYFPLINSYTNRISTTFEKSVIVKEETQTTIRDALSSIITFATGTTVLNSAASALGGIITREAGIGSAYPLNIDEKGTYRTENIAVCAGRCAPQTLLCNACRPIPGLSCAAPCDAAQDCINRCVSSGGQVELLDWSFKVISLNNLNSLEITNIRNVVLARDVSPPAASALYSLFNVLIRPTNMQQDPNTISFSITGRFRLPPSVTWNFTTRVLDAVGLSTGNQSTSIGSPTFTVDVTATYALDCDNVIISNIQLSNFSIDGLVINIIFNSISALAIPIPLINRLFNILNNLVKNTINNTIQNILTGILSGKSFVIPFPCS